MAREFSRARRVGEHIQRELARILLRELGDPRLTLVTITGVKVSRDLAHAAIYITRMGDAGDHAEVLTALGQARSLIRRELGQRMKLRTVPDLRFHYDPSIEDGARIDALIELALADDRSKTER